MTHDGKEAQTVTAFDAKNRLGRLLDRVQSGEELVITRHGEPVAWLIPFEKRTGERVKSALEVFRKVRESLRGRGKSNQRRNPGLTTRAADEVGDRRFLRRRFVPS